MNITTSTNRQNFGIRLIGIDGKEIKNFGIANNYNNTPASRGNFFTTLKIRKVDARTVGDAYVTTLGFDIENPLFGKHSLIKEVKMKSLVNPLKDKNELLKLLNVFTGAETANCQELENQAFSKFIKKRFFATGEKPLTVFEKELKYLNRTLVNGKQHSHFCIFSAERMLQFRNMAKTIARELKLKRI